MTSSSKIKYKVLDTTTDGGFYVLEMESAPFAGVQWTYGAVSFEERVDDMVALKYDVNIVSKHTLTDQEHKVFYDMLGDILVETINKQIETGEVQYHGGSGKIETNTGPDRDDLPSTIHSDIHSDG